MTAPVQLAQDLEKASSMVMTAKRLLAGGTTVDLAALEGKIRCVCENVAQLPREQGQNMIPALEKLMGDLDRLAEMVCDRMDVPPPGPLSPNAPPTDETGADC